MQTLIRIPVILLAAVLAFGMASTPAFAQADSHGDDHATETQAGHDDTAHAGDDHGHGDHEEVGAIPTPKQGLAPAITALVVFGIVFFVLSSQVWPKINAGLQDRENKIREEIAAAEAAQKQAKAALESYEQSLAEARAEAQRMLEETRGQQQKMAAELKAKADTEVAQMREKALRDIEAAKRAALGEIYSEVATLATGVASKILEREVSAADHQKLVDASIAELSAATN